MTQQQLDSPLETLEPQKWFAHMRRAHGGDKKFAMPRTVLEQFLNRIPSAQREQARRIWEARYSLTYGQIHDELMAGYLSQTRLVLTPAEAAVAEHTYFGILETHDFNGYAGFTPRGDRVVVLHQGLGNTVNTWAEWFARCVVEHDGVDYLAREPTSLKHTLEFTLRAWFSRLPEDFGIPDVTPETEDGWNLSDCLTTAAVIFVIGHELGHLIHAHRSYSDDWESNHAAEYEADRTGLSICLRHALHKGAYMPDNYYTKFMLSAPWFLLCVMSLLGAGESETHPAPSSRLARLLPLYQEELHVILGERFEEVVRDISDEDLLGQLRANSERIYRVFGNYRALMEMIDIGPRTVNNSWLRTALASS